jgi:hypothetical protein
MVAVFPERVENNEALDFENGVSSSLERRENYAALQQTSMRPSRETAGTGAKRLHRHAAGKTLK